MTVETITDGYTEWKTHDRIFSEAYMYQMVQSAAESMELSQTLTALPLMKKLHEGQYRKGVDQVPYINHPLMMACHALSMGITQDSILAAILLHDVCEDCGVTPAELPVSDEVREVVRLLTFEMLPGEARADAKARYFAAIEQNGTAILVKLLDRCNNVSMMATGFSRQKMIRYINETDKYLVPMIYILRNNYPEFNSAAFILKYQLLSMLETLKRTLVW